ncbi:MAG: fibronectin type III domain-containing protein, partial [Muribaculaceae bacterium]|nr:fibronectin type III domain-containing protein [Muribaculaceae bacterium]
MNKNLLFLAAAAAFCCAPEAFAQAGVRPGTVTDLEVAFDFNNGNPIVNGSFRAPTKSGDWSDPIDLTEIGRIEITRSCYSAGEYDEPIAEFQNPKPGELYTFSDSEFETFGYEYTYNFKAYSPDNISGYGEYKYVFIGVKPQKPQITSVETGEKGSAPVTINFTAPTQTSDGKELPTALTKIILTNYIGYMNEEELMTVDNPEPGKSYTFVHSEAVDGSSYTYHISAQTDFGKSDYESYSIYIGIDVPEAPSGLTATETDEGMKLAWTAPEKGNKGGYFEPADTRFKVERITSTDVITLAEDITETEFTDDYAGLTGPTTTTWRITAFNTQGEGGACATDRYVVGPSCMLPFIEDFNNKSG